MLTMMSINEQKLYTYVGEALRNARVAASLTQSQVAEATGLLRTSVTNIEAGRQKAPVHVLFRLCDVLQIEVANLLPSLADVSEEEPERQLATQHLQQIHPRTAAFVDRFESSDTETDDVTTG